MRFLLFIRPLLGICLVLQVNSQPGLREQVDKMKEIFRIYEELGRGHCSLYRQQRLATQLENMQDAALLANQQTPKNREEQGPSSAAVVRSLFSLEARTKSYHMFEVTVNLIDGFLDPQQLDEPRTFRGNVIEQKSAVFCDNPPIYLMSFDQAAPFDDSLHRTVGQLYGSGDGYWYLWVPWIQGVSRVLKTDFPTVPQGDPGDPFDYCANPESLVWSFVVDRWPGQEAKDKDFPKRAVFIFCPNYFGTKMTRYPGAPLPDQIDLRVQARGTPLDDMRPAWLPWYMQIARSARQLYSPRGPLRWADAIRVTQGGSDQIKNNYEPVIPHQKALSVKDCMVLAEWELASPIYSGSHPTKSEFPSIWNPPSYAWYTLAVWLQEEGFTPQNWATGSAGDVWQECEGGYEEGGGDRMEIE